MYRFATLRIAVYLILTGIILIVSFFPVGSVINFVVTDGRLIHYLLSPFYLFLGYCLTVIIFGIVHSQFAVRLLLPYTIAPGIYPHHSSAPVPRRMLARPMPRSVGGLASSLVVAPKKRQWSIPLIDRSPDRLPRQDC